MIQLRKTEIIALTKLLRSPAAAGILPDTDKTALIARLDELHAELRQTGTPHFFTITLAMIARSEPMMDDHQLVELIRRNLLGEETEWRALREAMTSNLDAAVVDTAVSSQVWPPAPSLPSLTDPSPDLDLLTYPTDELNVFLSEEIDVKGMDPSLGPLSVWAFAQLLTLNEPELAARAIAGAITEGRLPMPIYVPFPEPEPDL